MSDDADWDKSDEKKILAFEKPAVLTDRWEGEDEDDVKDNWDDEDEEESTPTASVKENGQVSQPSTRKKKLTKKEERALRREEAEETVDLSMLSPEELLAYKKEQQRLQEESDLLLAKEAFGGSEVTLSSRHDYESFKKMIVDKLSNVDKSPTYVKFLEDLIRELCAPIEAEDIKKITSDLNALFNEKMKIQKQVTKPKKKGKGYALKVERSEVDAADGGDLGNEFDDFM